MDTTRNGMQALLTIARQKKYFQKKFKKLPPDDTDRSFLHNYLQTLTSR